MFKSFHLLSFTDYQTNTASPIHQEHSSPTHLNDHKSYNSDRFTVPYTSTMPVPVLPVRNDLRRPSTYTFPSSRFKFGKAVSKRCSWKCVAIVFILLFLALLPVLAYFIAVYMSNMQQIVRISHACGTNGQIASDSRYNNDVSSTSELNSDSDSDLNSMYSETLNPLHANNPMSHILKHEKWQMNSEAKVSESMQDLMKAEELLIVDSNNDDEQIDAIDGSGETTVVTQLTTESGMDAKMMHDEVRLEAKGSPRDNKIDLVSSMSDKKHNGVNESHASILNYVELPKHVLNDKKSNSDDRHDDDDVNTSTFANITSISTELYPQGQIANATELLNSSSNVFEGNHTVDTELFGPVSVSVEANNTNFTDEQDGQRNSTDIQSFNITTGIFRAFFISLSSASATLQSPPSIALSPTK
ncbi:Uncharacterised protein g11182 [Pycnogonum litorale]